MNVYIDDVTVKEVKMGNHGTTTFYGDEIFTQTDAQWDSTGAFTSWIYYDHTTNGGVGTLKQDNGWTLYEGRRYEFKMVLGTGHPIGVAIKSYDGAVTHVAEDTYAESTTHTITFTPTSDKDGLMIDVDGGSLSNNPTTGSWSLKEVGVAAGWTTADAEPLIPQTALMGMSKPMVFDGVDDKVTISDNAAIDLGAGDFTISLWANIPDWTDQNLIYKRQTANDRWYVACSGGDALTFYSKAGGVQQITYSGTAGALTSHQNKWVHLVIVADRSDSIKGYINAALDDSDSGDTTDIDNSGDMVFGVDGSTGSTFTTGMLNEISLFKGVAFSLAEVQEIFNDGVALDATTHSQSSNLTGYWRNDGASTWTDRSTNSNDGTVSDTSPDTILLPEGTTSGKDILGFPLTHTNNGWLNLDGSEYVYCADNSVLDIEEAISIEAWIKRDRTDVNDGIINKRGNSSTANSFCFYVDSSDTLRFEYGSTGTNNYNIFTAANAITDTNWHHVVVVLNVSATTRAVLYLDKADTALVTDESTTNNIAVTTSNVLIGVLNESSLAGYFKGSLDEVRIYNRALSEPEVTKNYNHGKSKHS
jgi:hypothetical protein